ncbi:MAG TPA: 16S rRNA (cytosine(967)-C(5))-methyltransferase RsmB [Solirubrobacteraceae bacterium]|jgi:16S rRNA (cytosine967-C5)-methyltransferase
MPAATAARRRPATPARRAAYAVLRRVFEDGAWADRALHAAAGGLDARERALATRLAYGAVQRAGTLDHVAERLAGRPIDRLDPPVRAALRLGLFQLLYLDAIPDHAAVDSSVALARADAPRAAGLVNAVLRRATREAIAFDDDTPQGAALKHSVPPWLAERWFAELGPGEARALLAAINEPAEAALRANTLVTTRDALVARVPGHAAADDPEAIVLDAPFDAHGDALFAAGAYHPQSRASQRVARAVDPRPGERILDLCAAPGGKTTHLAALMGGDGEVVAVERHTGRANALVRTVARLRADGVVRVENADATDPRRDGPFDRVLVDPPCSGLGTLQSRPDRRWHATPDAPLELQAAILDAAAAATERRLVYATCTISRAENDDQVAAFLERHPDFTLSATHVTLPHRDATDGFYIATLDRA